MSEVFGRLIGYIIIAAVFFSLLKFLIFIFGLKVTVSIMGLATGMTLGSMFIEGSSSHSK